ncbi:hypothetical protein J6590_022467 [Homalodisca vitripennis]|nr:hypothetical protein J6590_022467 [Homalodisca vitripennis]
MDFTRRDTYLFTMKKDNGHDLSSTVPLCQKSTLSLSQHTQVKADRKEFSLMFRLLSQAEGAGVTVTSEPQTTWNVIRVGMESIWRVPSAADFRCLLLTSHRVWEFVGCISTTFKGKVQQYGF